MRAVYIKYFLVVSCLLFMRIGQAQKVVVLNLDTPIYAATADYIHDGLQKAKEDKVSCVILKLNTPGGLLKPTRKIVGDIMQSPFPVVAFVAPSGAHAGSAGAFIALAADKVVMAPGTNIGAAHPVTAEGKSPKGVLGEKITNDAVAFMRSIAEQRGRDFSLLKEMVTDSRSFSAKEALKNGSIDFIASNLSQVLNQLDQQKITLANGKMVTLQTANAEVIPIDISLREHFFYFLSNPNVMYLLLLIGIFGVLFEVFNPGGLVPGIIGVLGLILAAYGMTLLPINFTGLALIGLAIVLFFLEIKVISYGLLTLGGVISLGLGAVFLIEPGPSFDVIGVSWLVIIISVIITTLFFIFIIGLGVKAQFTKTVTGKDALKGKKGETLEALSPKGHVRVNGEIWKATALDENIAARTPIEVVAIKNFQLIVKPYL